MQQDLEADQTLLDLDVEPTSIVKKPRVRKEKPLPYDEFLSPEGDTQFGVYTYLEGGSGTRELDRICEYLLGEGSLICCDIETQGLTPNGCDILLVAFTYDGHRAYVFNPDLVDITLFKEVLEKNPVANQNCAFDYKFWYSKWGVEANIQWDTMLAFQLSFPGITKLVGGSSLSNLSKRLLGIELHKERRDLFVKGVWHLNELIQYAAEDVQATFRLVPITRKLAGITKQLDIWETYEKPLISILAKMGVGGVEIDLNKLNSLREEKEKELEVRKEKLESISPGINPRSFPQLLEYFTREIGEDKLPRKREGNTLKVSFDEERLKSIRGIHPAAKAIVDIREIEKQLDTYIYPWGTYIDFTKKDSRGVLNPITNRIHPDIKQCETSTGRCIYYDPNLQQAPRENTFRNIFVAGPGNTLTIVDLSQIELRIVAEKAEEPVLLDIFDRRKRIREQYIKELENRGEHYFLVEKPGERYPELKPIIRELALHDIHIQTAIKMFKLDPDALDPESESLKELRSICKNINFGILYGESSWAIANKMKEEDEDLEKKREEIQGHIDTWFSLHQKIRKWIDEVHKEVKVPVYGLPESLGIDDIPISYTKTSGGRIRLYRLPTTDNKYDYRRQMAEVERQASNMPIQGTCSDILKLSLIRLGNELPKGSKLLMTIHDEIVVETPKEKALETAKFTENIMLECARKFIKRCPVEAGTVISDCWKKG